MSDPIHRHDSARKTNVTNSGRHFSRIAAESSPSTNNFRLCSRHRCLGTDSGDGHRSISYLLPVPESGTSCGLPSLTLSVTVRVAVREPVVLGVNVTAMAQLSLGASELGQWLVGVKLPASAPVTATLEMSSAVVPVLVTVTSAVTLWPTSTVPKFRLYGLKLASGWITVVCSVTCCGLP